MSDHDTGASPENTSQSVDITFDRTNPAFDDVVGRAIDRALQDPDVADAQAEHEAKELESLDDLTDAHLEGATEDKVSYNDVLNSDNPTPAQMKALLKHMRADYVRKTQEISALKKQVTAAEALTNSDFKKKLDDAVAVDDTEFDPFDAASYEARIKKEAAKLMQEMLQPVEEQMRKNEQERKVETFKRQNPDWETYKFDMFKMMKADEYLTLDRAYKLVKAEAILSQQQEFDADLREHREAARAAGLKVGGSRRVSAGGVPDSIRAKGAVAIYRFLESQKQQQ